MNKILTASLFFLTLTACESKTDLETKHNKAIENNTSSYPKEIQTCLKKKDNITYFKMFNLSLPEKIEFCKKQENRKKYRGVYAF